MAAFYTTIISFRTTEPDPSSLITSLRNNVDMTIGIQHSAGGNTYILKKTSDTDWTAVQVNSAQNIIDTAPAVTSQTLAQSQIDNLPIAFKALVLALVDQINVLRAALPTPLPAITPAQAITAIRNKAATL